MNLRVIDTCAPDLGAILVTGATGPVGQRLVQALLAQGLSVSILTRSPRRVQALWPNAGIRVHCGDLTDPGSLGGLGDAIQTVFHLASHHPGPDEPDLYNAPDHWRVSAEGTGHLLRALADSPIERLVYVSSVRAAASPPPCVYGRAKHAAEQQVLAFGQRYGSKVSVLRLPMVYGLDGAGNLERLVRAVAARRFPPWPRLEQRRSAIHVEDAVAAMLLIACHPETSGQLYVATDGQTYSTRWIYEQILHSLGRPLPRWTVPLWALRLAAASGSLGERLLRRPLPLTLETLAKLTQDACYDGSALRRLGFAARYDLGSEIERLVQQLGFASALSPAPPPARSADSD